jgi:hypothetical protein
MAPLTRNAVSAGVFAQAAAAAVSPAVASPTGGVTEQLPAWWARRRGRLSPPWHLGRRVPSGAVEAGAPQPGMARHLHVASANGGRT